MKVKEFFERDGVSRLCPGKKDCVSVKLEDGRKEKVQKRLLLSNLKEIYQHFVTENPAVKVGFSAFAMLQPKWCVPVGSSGTHNVCICTYHQNVKLMLSFIDRSLDYKEVLKLCMCENNENCMLHHCDDCPNKSNVENYIKELLSIKFSENDVIKYKQW